MDLERSSRQEKEKGFLITDLIWLRCRMGTMSHGTRLCSKSSVGGFVQGKEFVEARGKRFWLRQSFFEPVVDQVVVSDATRAKVEALYKRRNPGLLDQLRQLNADGASGLDELNPQRLLGH